jgi:hypothetical protein
MLNAVANLRHFVPPVSRPQYKQVFRVVFLGGFREIERAGHISVHPHLLWQSMRRARLSAE